jgi:tetratricopeptide (TPR) repeat protein
MNLQAYSRKSVQLALAALAVLIVCGVLLGAGPATAPASSENSSYSHRFGKNLFLPSQAKADFEGFLKPEQIPTAAYCAKCHEDAHREWRESAHANSFRNPFYIKNVNLLIMSKGIEYTRHCEGCHNPPALFTGALTKDSTVNRAFDEDGVTCMVCHSIQKIQNTSGTGSYVMGVPAVMVNEDGSPVSGPVSYDDIFAKPKLHARAVMKDFYRTPEFCGVCHKAAVPKILNEYKWLRAFNVYDEWQQSSWSRETPLPFYKKDTASTCQTCHMTKVAAATDYGAKSGQIASHRFLGASTSIPIVYNYPDQLKQVTEYLKDGILGMDLFGITVNGEPKITAPLEKASYRVAPGDDVTVNLVIQNRKIGHSLVPEQRDFYEAWVAFEVKDAAGKLIYHSGFLKPDGYLDENAHSYTNRLISKEGKLLDQHEVWLTHARGYDNTILPGRSDLARYRFKVPAEAKGPLSLSAQVNYRRFRQGFTDFVFDKNKPTLPVIELASVSGQLKVGDVSEGAPAKEDDKDMLRWNNYGIALLDQRQFARAAEAFEHVVELKPDYADGYINIAITDFSWEKYDAAAEQLEKALKISPGNPRALFYQAMVWRVQGKYAEAIQNLKQVIAAYPRVRQAHDEMGSDYYELKQYDLARQEYEALQAIDPDDLSAHYNLARIYRRLGMKEKAAEQAALFADRKNDPGATAYANEFLRLHADAANESVPYHVHGQTAPQN